MMISAYYTLHGECKNYVVYTSGSQPGGSSPLGGNSAFLRGGIRHCQDLKKI